MGQTDIDKNTERYRAWDTGLTDALVLLSLAMSVLVLNFARLGATSTLAGSLATYCYVGWRLLITLTHAMMNGLLISHRETLGPNPDKVYSVERTVVLGLVNFLEFIILFATLYAAHKTEWFAETVPWTQGSLITPIYFSAATQLTIGYGDIAPIDETGRLCVVIQSFVGLVLTLVLLGRFMSSLSQVKDLNS